MAKISHQTEKFFSQFTKLTFIKGQTILSPGAKSNSIYYLKKGFVKQFTKNSKGEELIINQYRPGSFFHLKWLISPKPNEYHFESITSAIIYRAPATKVKQLLRTNPDILWETTQRLINGLDGMSKRLEILILNPASSRVTSLLTYFKQKYGNPIPFRLTHAEIASWIGTARETVSLEMEKLKKAGKIKKNKRLLEIQKD